MKNTNSILASSLVAFTLTLSSGLLCAQDGGDQPKTKLDAAAEKGGKGLIEAGMSSLFSADEDLHSTDVPGEAVEANGMNADALPDDDRVSLEYTGDNYVSPFIPVGQMALELGLNIDEDLLSAETDTVTDSERVEVVEVTVSNERPLEPLEYFGKGEIIYQGQLTNRFGEQVALVTAPDGFLYKAGVGDRVGLSQARVAQINEEFLVLVTGGIVDRVPLKIAAN